MVGTLRFAHPTKQRDRGESSVTALSGTDLPPYVMEPNARDPNNQGSFWNAKSWDQRNTYGVIS
jgi:hypothetical protein